MAELKFGPTYFDTYVLRHRSAKKNRRPAGAASAGVCARSVDLLLVVEPVYTTSAAAMLSHGAGRNHGGGAGARHRRLSI